jgi:four helix bundle protein
LGKRLRVFGKRFEKIIFYLKMRNFRELDIWKESRLLVAATYMIMRQMPDDEKFGLTSQIKRSVISIPSNIAEGCAKSSDKDLCRFLEISLGSCFELETQLMLCTDINYLDENIVSKQIESIQILEKRIASFLSYLRNKPNTKNP